MRIARRRLTKKSIESANHYCKLRISRAKDLLYAITVDEDRVKRRKACLCKQCWYEPARIGGCAMSSRQCAFCDEEIQSGNTCVSIVCGSCAEQAGICRDCGADLEYINLRSRSLPDRADDTEDSYDRE